MLRLVDRFKKYANNDAAISPSGRFLLAVSGGVDSVVLCELFHQCGYEFEMAHANFQLRGAASDEDESLVVSLSNKYQVKLHIKKFDTTNYMAAHQMNVQVAARELRYQWFNEILEQVPTLSGIVTAHHANDNVETVLMNFFKGSGIKGLQGMRPKESGIGGRIVRPLLFAKKEEILEFALQHELIWREDASNESDKYTRNYFRNQVLPSVEKVIPGTAQNIINNIARFTEINLIYEEAITGILNKLLEKKGEEQYIPVMKLKKLESRETIMFEYLKRYQFSSAQIPEAMSLLDSESGKYITSATHRLLRNRQWLILSPLFSLENKTFLIEKATTTLDFDQNHLVIEHDKPFNTINKDVTVAQLDNKQIEYPLIIRKWKQGDYFYPLGMSKKKKVSRYFIDIKLSMLEKENAWVIESGKKIIWVVGYRIDDRFKITPSTKNVTTLKLVSPK